MLLCLSATLITSCSSCSRPSPPLPVPPATVPRIRVLLVDGAKTAQVAVRGAYEVRTVNGAAATPGPLAQGDKLSARNIRTDGIDLVVDDLLRTSQPIEIVPDRVPVELNGRRYRGSLQVSLFRGSLRIVNVIDLEGYLRGVVPAEVPPKWPAAALEAQAIAARTYALARLAQTASRPFDVYATVTDQAYSGYEGEANGTDDAVAATAGLVLHYRDKLFTAYYSACCGGHTADGRIVFRDRSPLPPAPMWGAPCGYCNSAPRFRWSVRIPLKDAAAKLGEPNLTGIALLDVRPDGRPADIRLVPSKGPNVILSAQGFRERLRLWSTLFTARADGADFVFDGFGWGHGVGLCQWGAYGMAKAGKSRDEILAKYYPGATLARAYAVNRQQ